MRERRDFRLGALLFCYGGVAHLLGLRLYVTSNYDPGASRAFVDHPITNAGITFLGGASLLLLMGGLARRVRHGQKRHVIIAVIEGAARGVAATLLALETFYILASIFLACRYAPGGTPPLAGFLAFFIGIQTYGMLAMFASFPFALAYGGLAGLMLSWLTRRWPGH